MKKLRVAVVGAGIYGINHVNAYLWNENTDLVAVCDLDSEIRKSIEEKYRVKTYADVEEMLNNEDIDAVSIATPDAFHLEPSLTAIRHGKPILVEKPLATTIEDATKILEEAKKHNVRVAVDYHKRWDPAAINLKNELSNVGKPIRGYMSMDDIIDVPTEWFNWAHKSSPVHFLGTHCYDQIRWFMGCEVVEVYAVGNKDLLSSKGIDTYDSVQAILTFENGCHWTVENSWVFPKGFAKNNDGRTQIVCENGLLRADSQNRGVEIFDNKKCKTPNSYFILESNGRPMGFGIEPINDFVYCLLNEKPFVADAFDGLQAERIAEAVHRSLDTHRAVKLSEI
ncbi:dehydrogenase [Erysipelotrichaceae bacterium MTC7]|nr:dehydrogenase [Erysipelotrichaceae bacterium MTC7]